MLVGSVGFEKHKGKQACCVATQIQKSISPCVTRSHPCFGQIRQLVHRCVVPPAGRKTHHPEEQVHCAVAVALEQQGGRPNVPPAQHR